MAKSALWILAVAIICCNGLLMKSKYKNYIVQSCPKLSIYKAMIRYKKASGIARIKCASTHALIGHNYIYCSNNKWIGEIPKCVAKSPQCNRIDEGNYPNGQVFIHTNYNRAVASFSCHLHYELRGSETIYCLGTKWNTNLPVCVSSGNAVTPTSCNFDTDLCGWTQDINHDFDWERIDGKNTKEGHIWTGPRKDHTPNSTNGYFMYFNSWDDLPGDAARLYSPLYSPDNFTAFEFYFYHVGNSVLNVYVKDEKITEIEKIKPMFTSVEKNNGGSNSWQHAFLDLRDQQTNFQIVIEGVRGDGILNDIAVDDVRLITTDFVTEESDTSETYQTITTDGSIVLDEDISCLNRCNETFPRRYKTCQCWSGCFNYDNCCADVYRVCLDRSDDFVTILPIDASTISETTQRSTSTTEPTSTRRTTTQPPTTKRTTTQRTTSTTQRTTTQKTQPTTQSSTTALHPTVSIVETADLDQDFIDTVPNLGDFDQEESNVIISQVSSKTDNTVPYVIILIGVLTVVMAIAATVFYSVRNGRGDRNWNQSTNDVRYLTSDEILDFTLATADNNDSDLLLQEENIKN